MSVFTEAELLFLRETRLARIATVGADGAPHVTPVGFVYNPEHDSIEVGGFDLSRTKKYRDVQRTGRVAIVIDDNPSVDPWHVRGIEVRGSAEALDEAQPLIRIRPERVLSWGLDGAAPRDRHARTVRPRRSTGVER
jgi:pyridoxamine 5'-phosphate oxidase family protein